MVSIENKSGRISIPDDVFTNLAGEAATSCFGVKGMVSCANDGAYWQLLRRESMAKGVKLHTNDDGSVVVELHIAIDQGVNIPAVGTSIQNEVIYKLGQLTGITVERVDVYIDTIMND